MAGIGDYKEGEAFKLRSGNKTSYKDMGSSFLSDSKTPLYNKKETESMTSKKNPDANEKKEVNKKINNVKYKEGPTIFGQSPKEFAGKVAKKVLKHTLFGG